MRPTLLFALFFSFCAFSQEKVKQVNFLIDTIDISVSCEIDTNVYFHFNSKLEWLDTTFKKRKMNYNFSEGTETYFEIKIQTKNCRCADCDFSEIFFIRIDDINTDQIINFNQSNSFWMEWDVWRIFPLKENFSGTLDFTKHTLTIHENKIAQPTNIIDKTYIFNKLISISK